MPKNKKIYMPEDDMNDDMVEMKAMDDDDMDDMDMDDCDQKQAMMPGRVMLAHAYVPWQNYDSAFSPKEALSKGTLFPELWGVYPIPK